MNRKKLKKYRLKWKKYSFYDEKEFDEGLEIARTLTKDWNSQTNPKKVFIMGRRVHHGTGGAAMSFIAIATRDCKMLGLAYGLMEDDIDDSKEWFDFEKGGEPDSFYSTK